MRGRGVAIIPTRATACTRWLDATRVGSLQRVANRPILCHVLDALVEAGVQETAIVAPPELASEVAASIEHDGHWQARAHVLSCDAKADPAGALQAIADFADGSPTIVHRADGLLDSRLSPILELMMLGDGPEVLLLVAQDARDEQRLDPAAQRALRLAEIDPTTAALGLAGVCALAPGMLEQLSQSESATPGLELADLAAALAARARGRVDVRVVREWRAFSEDTRDLLDINRIALERIQTDIPPDKRRGNRVEGHVQIDASATVAASVICGPAVIGAGAMVRDSYIGPHTSIGERVRLEGAEIEQSVVFAGASILHVGRRLVASVVGRDASIFRDFSVPRAMRVQVGDGDMVALC
jgi:glucose-1-phosphate thymidylyltransferase